MSQHRGSVDLADRLVGWAVALAPADRLEWGRAMQAELTQVVGTGPRRRFAIGCLRVLMLRAPTVRTVGYVVIVVGVLAATVRLTGGITFAPLHVGLIILVVVQLALSWLGRRRGAFGPVGTLPAARMVRAGCYLLVGGAVLIIGVDLGSTTTNVGEKAWTGIPVFGVMLALYTLAFVSVSARPAAVSGRPLAAGAGLGLAAALLWLLPVLVWPPLPKSGGGALLAVVLTAVAAFVIGAGKDSRVEDGAVAALLAASVAALLLIVLAYGLLDYFPYWIPDIGGPVFPANVSAADRLEANRNYAQDPYVGVMFVGSLAAAALSVESLRRGYRSRLVRQERALPR